MKQEKDILFVPTDFEEYLQNQLFQRIAKFIQAIGIVILVKVDETYNILKSLLATGRKK